MLPPKGVTNAPKIQAITKITATRYNKLLIVLCVFCEFLSKCVKPNTKIVPKTYTNEKAHRPGNIVLYNEVLRSAFRPILHKI